MSLELALLLALLLLLGNAFFVAAEFALVSVRRSAIELKVLEGSRVAQATVGALENLSVLLAGAQLGVTLCSLGLGALGEPAVSGLLEGPFQALNLPESFLHPVSFALALAIITFLHVIIGEVVPKNIALAGPERVALLLTPALLGVVRLLRPVIMALNWAANTSLRAVGIVPKGEVTSAYSRDEVADLVEESHREGLLSEDEEHMLQDALKFDRRTVKSVYIPVGSVVTVNKAATPAGIEKLAASTGFSRFPVEVNGRLTGYIHLKDVLETDATKRLKPVPSAKVRQFLTIPVSATLRRVLKTMQKNESHLVAVVDGKQRVIGVAALEDVLEELVGEMEAPAERSGR
jgi:CBS domain containing-hemolysin-like protein